MSTENLVRNCGNCDSSLPHGFNFTCESSIPNIPENDVPCYSNTLLCEVDGEPCAPYTMGNYDFIKDKCKECSKGIIKATVRCTGGLTDQQKRNNAGRIVEVDRELCESWSLKEGVENE